MKKQLILIACAIVCLIAMSCQKNDPVYSCDPEIDKWVKANLTEIKELSRTEIKSLSGAEQRGIYRACTPEKKKEIWIDKINEVLSFNFNPEERAHIESLLHFIHENNFIFECSELDATDAEIEKLSLFLYRWTEYAINELGWNMESCRAIIVDFGETKVQNKNGIAQVSTIERSVTPLVSTRSETTRDCNCNLTSIWYDTCEKETCNSKSTGCGGFTFFECNGVHKP